MSELFKKLRAVRKSRRLKQEEVAQRAGISREAYLRAESGQADPRMSTFLAACDALGLDAVLVPRHLSAEVNAFLEAHDPLPTEPGRRGITQVQPAAPNAAPASEPEGDDPAKSG